MDNQSSYFACEWHQYESRTNFSSLHYYSDWHFCPNVNRVGLSSLSSLENLVLKWSIYQSASLNMYLETENVQIIEFPRDVMNSSKDIQLPIMESHGMAISHSRDFSLIFDSCEFIVSQAKTPKVIQPVTLILSSEDINMLIVSSDG